MPLLRRISLDPVRPCRFCLDEIGKVYEIGSEPPPWPYGLRGVPAHPLCRCSYLLLFPLTTEDGAYLQQQNRCYLLYHDTGGTPPPPAPVYLVCEDDAPLLTEAADRIVVVSAAGYVRTVLRMATEDMDRLTTERGRRLLIGVLATPFELDAVPLID